ncbi:pyruvate carboxyltransferase [Amycolatopsis antarctica]|uniref:2-isopropylmalate synthase n=1 Tax=Amycolatopsis antarctica TaxID=1854586 RepID=A0A263D5F9_9PSEU|nr:pyruvate carboxyltransferase [Amycolatopsis antarctica]OZM73278.1 pyruvate carboxyltransferase [Amycolatopsis antarctica]
MAEYEASHRRRVRVFDATLRDGEQAPGNTMSPEQKVELAMVSEAYGSDTIEAGFPGSSPVDFTATQLIADALTTAKFATFNRTSLEDVELSMKAGGARENHQVQICGTGSELHLEHKRGISRDEAVREVGESIRFALSLGAKDVSFGVEDASRGSHDLIHALVDEALDAGAGTIILADTTGYALPQEFGALCAVVRSWLPHGVNLSTHCHDDLGFSLANALAGVEAGANEVQCTLGGIGERAGNTPLEQLAAVLRYKENELDSVTRIETERLYAAYERLAEIISLQPSRNKPIFGVNAFSTQAGIHQAGILRNPATYEYINPSSFGRERALLVGRHSGRAILRYLLDSMDVTPDPGLLDDLYEEFVVNRPNSDCDELGDLRNRVAARLSDRAVVGAGS